MPPQRPIYTIALCSGTQRRSYEVGVILILFLNQGYTAAEFCLNLTVSVVGTPYQKKKTVAAVKARR